MVNQPPTSEAPSNSTGLHHRSVSTMQKLEIQAFHFIKRIFVDTKRFQFLALFLVILEILQLCGLVINDSNISHWDDLFDFRFVKVFALPVSIASSQLYSWASYFTVLTVSVAFISLLSLCVFLFSEKESGRYNIGSLILKAIITLFCSFLYVPFVSILTSSLTCLPSDSDPPLYFYPFFSQIDCWSLAAFVVKTVSLIVIVVLFLITFVFYTLWLFRSIYILASFIVPVLFIKTIPFYKKQSNQVFCVLISQWPTSSITLLGNILITSYFSLTDDQSGFLILIVWTFVSVILAVVSLLLVSTIYNNYSLNSFYNLNSSKVTKGRSQTNHTVSIGVDDDGDYVGSSDDGVIPTQDVISPDVDLPLKFLFQIELFARFLQPKPHKCKRGQVDVASQIMEHGIVTFPDSIEGHLYKCNFETFVKENHLSIISLSSIINNLEVDLSFRQRYLLFFYQKSSEAIRRKSNTGEDYLDAKSSTTFQKNFREVKELHQDCLEALSQFWNVLLNETVDLSRLPLITDKLRVKKLKADHLYTTLLGSFPGHRDLLLSYSVFCKDIKMDDELATSIMESLEIQSTNGSSDAQSQRSSVLSKSSFTKARRRMRRRKGVDLSSSSSNDHRDLVSVLSRMIFGSFGLLFIVSLISFWFFSDTLHDVSNRVQQLLESSHVLAMSNKAVVEARMYSIFYNSTLEPHFKKEIVETAEHINYHARRIFMSADALTTTSSFICPRVNEAPLDRINDELINNFIRNPTMVAFTHLNTVPSYNKPDLINYWDLVSSFASSVFNYISSFDYDDVAVDSNRFFRFFTDNRRILNTGGSILWETILESSQSFFDSTKLIILLSSISSVICLFIIGFLGFYRIIAKISYERQSVLNLFLWVPSDTCHSIVSDLSLKIKKFARSQHAGYDFDEVSETNEDEESHLCEEISHSEEVRTDESVTLSIKSDRDYDTHYDEFQVKYRFSFSTLLVVAFLILLSLSLVFSFNSVSFNHEHYISALTSGEYLQNSVVELFVLDYVLTSRTYGLVNSGDLFFYQSYWSFLNSGTREILLESIFYDYDVSNQIKMLIADTSVSRDRLLYFDTIAQVLAVQVYQLDSEELLEIKAFTYDLKSETTLFDDLITFNYIDHWYSDLETDSDLIDEEKFKVIRTTIGSDRYFRELQKLNQNQELVFDLLDNHIDENILHYFSSIFLQFWIAVFISISFVLLLSIPFCFNFQLRHHPSLRLILITLCVTLLFLSLSCLLIFVHHRSELNSIDTTSSVVLNLLDYFFSLGNLCLPLDFIPIGLLLKDF
ncbi:hypothetical protein GEMRC1_011737 [Eukaryota sp. GEM-RC1]